jgi:hypothetical protein
MKNKTIPWSEVADGVSKGVIGGVAVGVAGPSLLNAAITSAAGTIGYQIGGTPGALIGGAVGSKFSEKINNAYQTTTKQNESSTSGYEEIPNNSSRVNGGTVVVTRKIQQREPSKQKKMLISRLGDALKDVTPSNREPPSKKIKESKLLKDIERQQKTYGTIQQSDIEPREQKPSALTQLKEGVKDVYRRLSGTKKGQYTQLSTSDPDFKTTLESSKREGQKQGTYAILPQEEMDFDTEMEAMTRSARKRQPKTQEASLLDTQVPTQAWPAMQQFKTGNETNIRKSIARTDKAEREERMKQGLLTPPPKKQKTPRTPKQQITINNFGALVTRSQEKQKEERFEAIIQDAYPLITKREIKRFHKQKIGEIESLSSQIASLETQAAKLQPVIEKREATRLQTAMRGKIARNTLQKTRTNKKNTAATTIQKTIRGKITRNKIINDYEDQVTRAEKKISDLRSNLNDQRPEGLRKAKKTLQDRKSDITTRGKTDMNREQKKEETRRLNTLIEQYEDVITKRKTGPKVKERIDQYEGAALTPKKK